DSFDRLAKLLDFRGFDVSEHGGGTAEIVHFFGPEAHDAAGGGVGGDGIVSKQEHACGLRISLNWAIPFHAEDAVYNDEIGAGRGIDIEDGAVDAGPVKNVFWPTVATAGHDSEKIFHGKGNASPVVRFELGHGDEEIRAENRFGEIQLLEERGAGFERHALDVINIEIAKVPARPIR